MNDAGIDDALELGLSSCLRSLQRSNPELLLTANQLKRTERDVRYLPAIAASLSSIIKNSSNAAFRSDVYEKVMSWEAKTATAAPIIEGIESNLEGNAKAVGDEDKGDDESISSRGSAGSEIVLNETMDSLSAIRLATLIEDQLRYCISDENRQRKKEEEREKKLEARRQKQAKKKKKKTKNGPEGKANSVDISDGDDTNIDLDDLLLEGTADDEDMESSQQSDDASTSSHETRTPRSDDDSDEDHSSTQNDRNDSKCREDDDFSEEDVFLPSSIVTPAPTSTEGVGGQMANEEEGEEKKDDGFDEEDDWW